MENLDGLEKRDALAQHLDSVKVLKVCGNVVAWGEGPGAAQHLDSVNVKVRSGRFGLVFRHE